ncbi:hypothetical protein Sjap_001560 [Stephania japonica]|uniref:Uncharacterized protein n=1 Tax=Stephania japonica TaxID=461633 RepID=A0AAP0KMR2_9MAGN
MSKATMPNEFVENLDTQWNAALIKAPCSHGKNSSGNYAFSVHFHSHGLTESKISQWCSKSWDAFNLETLKNFVVLVDEVPRRFAVGGEAAENAGRITRRSTNEEWAEIIRKVVESWRWKGRGVIDFGNEFNGANASGVAVAMALNKETAEIASSLVVSLPKAPNAEQILPILAHSAQWEEFFEEDSRQDFVVNYV